MLGNAGENSKAENLDEELETQCAVNNSTERDSAVRKLGNYSTCDPFVFVFLG